MKARTRLRIRWIDVGLRALMEMGIVAALGYWGYRTGDSAATRWALAIGAPLVGFGFWGLVDFRWAGRAAEPLRLTQELAVTGLAALAWYSAGGHVPGLALAAVSAVYHTLVYLNGDRLLGEPRPV
jgi:hypothetical protein